MDNEESIRIFKRLKNTVFDITGIRLNEVDSCCYIFYVIAENRINIGNPCVRVVNPTDSTDTPGPLFISNEAIKATLEKLILPANNKRPILIYGQSGTGIDALVQHIHITSAYRSSPLLIIDCEKLNEKWWESIVDNSNSPMNNLGCTVFFSNIHLLSMDMQKTVNVYIDDTLLLSRHQVLASAGNDIHTLTSQALFLYPLYQKLCCVSIRIPSLNEMPEDIPALVSLLISQYNMEYAKHTIGFDDEAMDILKRFHWELNLDQLQNAIRQLVIMTDKSYISANDVNKVLARPDIRMKAPYPLDLKRTLSEIEQDIIRYVIADENMNQSRAAKRLDISRSTMWRKINPERHIAFNKHQKNADD